MKLQSFNGAFFLSAKKQTKNKILELVTDLKASHNVVVKHIRCDNAGENRDTNTYLRQAGKGVKFEFTSSDTPQHNGAVERRFATLYNRIRSMLHFCRCPQPMKFKVWAEPANTSSDLWNIQVQKQQGKSPHELFYAQMQSYAHNLQIFGQAGVVLKSNKKVFKAKLVSRGDRKYFVGYEKQCHHDVYRMWDPSTGRVSVTSDIRWLDSLLGDDFDNDGNDLTDDASVSGEDDKNDSDNDDKDNNKKDNVSDNEKDDSDNDSNGKHTDIDEPKDQSNDETESADHDDNYMVGNPKLQRELRMLNT